MKSYIFHNGFIQFIFSVSAKALLFLPVLLYTVIKLLWQKRYGELLNWFHQLGYMEDKWGNYFIKYPANDILIKPTALIKYGTNEETISKITAINYKHDEMHAPGFFMAKTMIFFNDKSFIGLN